MKAPSVALHILFPCNFRPIHVKFVFHLFASLARRSKNGGSAARSYRERPATGQQWLRPVRAVVHEVEYLKGDESLDHDRWLIH